ncbi:hypothetical protein HOA55_00830 [archaeon]|jgi:hypothetical protein|nr:hypothetical protein [archaeon]MBT3578200.1 hypothetical protein [archaeon]MBT6819879.1 hypothetical protein [archaeon]MBT6956381.1 hypothetical protein [archaeon]MBT7025661.1 hypothetical protein [archaeon]
MKPWIRGLLIGGLIGLVIWAVIAIIFWRTALVDCSGGGLCITTSSSLVLYFLIVRFVPIIFGAIMGVIIWGVKG